MQEEATKDCEVFEENWPAIQVFIACSTQWRRTIPPMGGALIYDGLIYGGVRDVIWAQGNEGKRAREIFADVQLMEAAALSKLQKAANKP